MKSFSKNYILIYFWQSLSIILGFVSLFIVIPYLSVDKTIFGVYSVCTSLTIFFSYADIGFLSAGIKYASEYYIKGDKSNEIKIVGFTAFMMTVFFLVLMFLILLLAFFPYLLIPELIQGSTSYNIAQTLLLILAFSCPIIIGQRILNMIFTIRVEDYKFQRIVVVGNLIKILSVLYFFTGNKYQIVQYYGFIQMINFLIVLAGCVYTKKFGYSFYLFISSFLFDKNVFNKVKKIGGTSFLLIISFILYYELDQVFISNKLGINAVATYGIALSILTIVRTYMSLLYSPFTARYNHFIGLSDFEGLAKFVCKMIYVFAPFVIFPILVLSLLADSFIHSWVGSLYSSSSMLVSLLVLSFIPNFVKDPINSYFIASEKNFILVKYAIFSSIFYWGGVLLTVNYLGLTSFALFKCLVPFITIIFYLILIRNDFSAHKYETLSISTIIKSNAFPIVICVSLCLWIKGYMDYSHTKNALFFNIFVMGVVVVISIIASFLFNKALWLVVKGYLNKILCKVKLIKL